MEKIVYHRFVRGKEHGGVGVANLRNDLTNDLIDFCTA